MNDPSLTVIVTTEIFDDLMKHRQSQLRKLYFRLLKRDELGSMVDETFGNFNELQENLLIVTSSVQ